MDENLLENGKHKKILKNQYRSNINRKNKLFYWSVLKEKIHAFKDDIKTKAIGEIHIYHSDTSILTGKKTERENACAIQKYMHSSMTSERKI